MPESSNIHREPQMRGFHGMSIDEHSAMSLSLEMYLSNGSSPIAKGTGFSIQKSGQHYIITNWHNVTGINPETNSPLSEISDPDILMIWFFTNTIGLWIRKKIKLKDSNGKKLWIEHPSGNGVDVVAIPYVPTSDIFIVNLDVDIANVKLKIYPSKAVSIIGYPNGLTSGGKFPIWKKGYIASEPDINYNDLPVFLIDATTRKGMSGSQVILRESGMCEMETGMFMGKHTKFLGIYSGRIDGDSEIGRVWKPIVITEILQIANRTDLLPGQTVE